MSDHAEFRCGDGQVVRGIDELVCDHDCCMRGNEERTVMTTSP